MTDEEIIAAVRTKTHVLVPRGSDWFVGRLTLDAWEDFEGEHCLVISMNNSQCREAAGVMLDVPQESVGDLA